MKNSPNPGVSPAATPASPEQPDRLMSVLRFWACFVISLAVLGLVAGLMLVGLFAMMGYRII